MEKIWFWGCGRYLQQIRRCILPEVKIAGIIDNAKELEGNISEGLTVYYPRKGLVASGDTIIITIMRYQDVIGSMKEKLGDIDCRIIPFFNKKVKRDEDILHIELWDLTLENIYLTEELYDVKLKLRNQPYELAEKYENYKKQLPRIESGKDALRRVIEENLSLCRFGDGEFEIILGRNRASFQKTDSTLGVRLKEVLTNNEQHIITCIADNYGCLDKYTDRIARAIREYLSAKVRHEHMELLNSGKIYYDAYISRPYIIYRDKTDAEEKFDLWKKVWKNKDVIMVEGELTRSGFGNDLFGNVRSFQRILCPAENAWNFYVEIYNYIKENIGKDRLILCALGPAATVLTYDLTRDGYQVIDIGHLDNEYEWFLRRVEDIVNLKYKYVNEYTSGRNAEMVMDFSYQKEIIKRIGC